MPFKKNPPAYYVWASMKDRCYNPKSASFSNYGGRGITVCDRWKSSYKDFYSDMGPRPDGYSIDRIDVDGNYEPGNCRWADQKTQQRNQRRAVFVTIEGVKHRAIELAEQHGLKVDTIVERSAKGMTFADVVSTEAHRDLSGLALGGKASGAAKSARTHCKRGHEFTPENTRITTEGFRACRQCHNAKMRRRNAAKRAA